MGPNGQRFFDQALPRGQGGHVLAIGVLHTDAAHIRFLSANLPQFVNRNRLGAIGNESIIINNVFLWAYRDGRLPVSAAHVPDYMRTIVTNAADEDYGENGAAKADLYMQAIDFGVNVVQFDARSRPWRQENDIFISNLRTAIRNEPGLADRLRRDPEALETFAANYRFTDGESNPGLTRFLFTRYEALEIIRNNRRYAQRLDQMDRIIEQGTRAGIGEDALSAAVFSSLADRSRNAITLSGIDHIRGTASERIQGTFNHHLRSTGTWNVTELMIPDENSANVHRWIGLHLPGGVFHQGMQENCQIRSAMHFYSMRTDTVVDLSRPASEIASEITLLDHLRAQFTGYTPQQTLARAGLDFTCNNPGLPTFDQSFQGERANPLANPAIGAASETLRRAGVTDPGVARVENALRGTARGSDRTRILNELALDPEVLRALPVMLEDSAARGSEGRTQGAGSPSRPR